ncbi:MAG: hypothetical protein JSV44_06930, partial [Candidatus Zixiibacteriota bacterium]
PEETMKKSMTIAASVAMIFWLANVFAESPPLVTASQAQNDPDVAVSGEKAFLCGDVYVDDVVNVLDIGYLIENIFKGGPLPDPFEAGDVNSDGKINVVDIIILIEYKFMEGPDPVCLQK